MVGATKDDLPVCVATLAFPELAGVTELVKALQTPGVVAADVSGHETGGDVLKRVHVHICPRRNIGTQLSFTYVINCIFLCEMQHINKELYQTI